jgi:hypothetical protein
VWYALLVRRNPVHCGVWLLLAALAPAGLARLRTPFGRRPFPLRIPSRGDPLGGSEGCRIESISCHGSAFTPSPRSTGV